MTLLHMWLQLQQDLRLPFPSPFLPATSQLLLQTDCWCDRLWRSFARSLLLRLLRTYCGVQNSESLLQP
jgi:hypothetical protein